MRNGILLNNCHDYDYVQYNDRCGVIGRNEPAWLRMDYYQLHISGVDAVNEREVTERERDNTGSELT